MSKITNLGVRMQIMLMLALPLLGLLFLVVISTLGKLDEVHQIEKTDRIIDFSRKLDHVAHNFAVERGLTAGFLGSKGQKFREKLAAQRQNADEAAAQIQSAAKSEALEFLFEDEQLKVSVDKLLEALQQRNGIREAVDALDPSAKPFDYYSGINANALYTIQLGSLQIDNPEVVRRISSYLALLWVKERAGQERGALNGVFSSGTLDGTAQGRIVGFIRDQDSKIQDFILYATDTQRQIFNENFSHEALPEFYRMRDIFQSRAPKTQILQKLNSILGYGGFIHTFKDYVLRGKESDQQKFDDIFLRIQQIMGEFRALPSATEYELKQLAIIEETFTKYYENIPMVTQMLLFGTSIEDVDSSVEISDTEAFAALDNLSQINEVDPASWFEKATGRIGKVKQLSEQIIEEVIIYDKEITATAKTALASYIIMTGIVLLAALLFAWWLARHIVGSISTVARALGDVQQSGDFSSRVDITNDNEIGQMAGAFNHLMDGMQSAIRATNTVVGGIARGDFSKRITESLQGDLSELKEGVNASATKVQETMDALNSVMKGLSTGDFRSRMEVDVEGDFKENVNNAMKVMEDTVGEISRVMGEVAAGNYRERILLDLPGDLQQLKSNTNSSMEALQMAVDDVIKTSEGLSNGDLTTRVIGDYQGQMNTLKNALNSSLDNLSGVIRQVNGTALQIDQGSQEMAAGFLDISSRTEEAAASLEETASTMDEMTSTVTQNSDNARMAAQLSASARNHAEGGVGVAHQAIDSMGQITESSQKIADIIGLIDGIAFQTNLLALNAAVEAARAGEQGRGFAVVAGEVRNLAQRSADAAQEIKQLIETSVTIVQEGSQQVEETGKALENILEGTQKANDIIQEIASASEEQSRGINQVNKAVVSLEEMTQQNAALVEEGAANSQAIKDQTSELAEQVVRFKL